MENQSNQIACQDENSTNEESQLEGSESAEFSYSYSKKTQGEKKSHYFLNPIDFQINASDLLRIRTEYSDFGSVITIKDINYNYSRSNRPGHIYEFSSDEKYIENSKLLTHIFEGEIIAVTHQNSEFLHDLSEVLHIDKLFQISGKLLKRGSIKSLWIFIPVKFFYFLYTVFVKLGAVGKFIITLWDLGGAIIYIGNFMCISSVWACAGIASVDENICQFLFLFLPLMLYTFYFSNIISIPIYQFCQLNFFSYKTFFPKLQELISYILFIIFQKPLHKNRLILFSLGRNYSFLIGVVFFIFVVLLISQFHSTTAIKGVEFYLLAFIAFIPLFNYTSIFILYWILCISSFFKGPCERFFKLGIFDDPYLTTIFLREKLIKNVFNEWRNPNGTSHFKLICRLIFSRFFVTLYILFAFFAYIIINRSKYSAGPVITIIIIFYFIIEILCYCISFPWIWWRRISRTKMTESQLNEEKESTISSIDSFESNEANVIKWVEDEICYRKKNSIHRWVSICSSISIGIVLFAALVIAISPKPKQQSFSETSLATVLDDFNQGIPPTNNIKKYDNETINKYIETYSHYKSSHGINTQSFCDAKIKGFSIESVAGLAMMVSMKQNELSLMKKTFFKPQNKTLDIIPTNFSIKSNGLFIRHFRISEDNLSIVSIRGTSSMKDSLCDFDMWATTVVTDLVSYFIPFFDYPCNSVRYYIGIFMALPRYMFRVVSLADNYVNQTQQYIKQVVEKDFPQDDILIVGHSLGGGLSKIVSLQTGYSSLAISGPGLRTVQWFYDNGYKNIVNSITDITPEQDIVAAIGGVTAADFIIPCNIGLFQCHDGMRTVCEMGIMCGKMKEELCKHYFDDKELTEMIKCGAPYHY